MTDVPTPVVAAFDLDGTLCEGGSVFAWLRYISGVRSTYFSALRLAGPLLAGALRSGSAADRAKERLFVRLLAGRDVVDITESSRAFALAHLHTHGRTHVLERLAWHQGQGHDVIIVSASPQIYVEVIAGALAATEGIGTRLAVDARGKLSGHYLGQNCRGDEKSRRLDDWINTHYQGFAPIIYAYGNSRGDRRLLSAATHPFDAGRLGALGSLRKFPRLETGTTPPRVTVGE